MADKKFSDLTTASEIKNNDYMAISQDTGSGLVSLKTTILAIANKIASGINFTSALQTTDKTITGAINEIAQGGGGGGTDVIAEDFDSTSTYAVGDYCIHEGSLYKCTTAVTTAGAWDSNDWTETLVMDEVEQGGGGGGAGHTILDDSGNALAQEDDLQFKGAYSHDDSTNGKTVVEVAREMTKAEFNQLSVSERGGVIVITDEDGGGSTSYNTTLIYDGSSLSSLQSSITLDEEYDNYDALCIVVKFAGDGSVCTNVLLKEDLDINCGNNLVTGLVAFGSAYCGGKLNSDKKSITNIYGGSVQNIYAVYGLKYGNGGGSGGGSGHTILDDEDTELPQEDNLQFKGVYSYDDDTNGKTVVEVVRYMTRAEYNLLSEDEKKGVIVITDEQPSGGSGGIDYSTTEQDTGLKWINGETIYQKTVYYAGGVYGHISFDHNISNFDKLISVEGFAYDTYTGAGYIALPKMDPNGYNVGVCGVTSTQVQYSVPSVYSARIVDVYVTLRYTKSSS